MSKRVVDAILILVIAGAIAAAALLAAWHIDGIHAVTPGM
jgi:hypothetical protein